MTVYALGDPIGRLERLYQEATPNQRYLDERRAMGSALPANVQGGST
jgi:hypothetical protein